MRHCVLCYLIWVCTVCSGMSDLYLGYMWYNKDVFFFIFNRIKCYFTLTRLYEICCSDIWPFHSIQMDNAKKQQMGPVVQSIVTLTSLLVVKMLTVLVSTISNFLTAVVRASLGSRLGKPSSAYGWSGSFSPGSPVFAHL